MDVNNACVLYEATVEVPLQVLGAGPFILCLVFLMACILGMKTVVQLRMEILDARRLKAEACEREVGCETGSES